MKKYFFASIALFIVLLFVIPPATLSSDLGNTLLTVVAFLFGIIAGFYIIITTTDYNSLKNTLAQEAAALISLYQQLSIYDRSYAQKLKPLVDNYVRRNFDFELIDYMWGTEPEFGEIERAVEEIPFYADKAEVFQGVHTIKNNLTGARQYLYVLSTRTLSGFQWGVLITLSLIFIGSLYSVRTGSIFFDVVTVALSGSVVLVLLLIKDLDRYVWNEQTFGFDILQNVLRTIGELPYYPAESLEEGRVVPREKEYRVGTFVGSGVPRSRKIEIHKVS